MLKGSARAHTNIALIKYWGKANEELIIPMNNSLSLTLDAFYTETTVIFSEDLTADTFYLDDSLQDEKSTEKVSRFLDLVRKMATCPLFAEVKSYNHVPCRWFSFIFKRLSRPSSRLQPSAAIRFV